jgi:hypothetical protein
MPRPILNARRGPLDLGTGVAPVIAAPTCFLSAASGDEGKADK